MTPEWIFITSLAVSLWLLVRGIRGRRIGNEPRCRKCEYDLTGLTSEKCPECGATIVAERTRRGHRRRRPWSMVLWTILLASQLTIAAIIMRGVNWWPQSPTWIVIRGADWGSKPAFDELVARHRLNQLSTAQTQQLAVLYLRLNDTTAEKQSMEFNNRLVILEQFDRAGLLSPDQQSHLRRQYTESIKEFEKLGPADLSSQYPE